jgi:hypothetical protein
MIVRQKGASDNGATLGMNVAAWTMGAIEWGLYPQARIAYK